jgi:putative ABC transport system substrate-binding protein
MGCAGADSAADVYYAARRKEVTMTARWIILLAIGLATIVGPGSSATAQQAGKLPRIGIAFFGPPGGPGLTTLLDGLRDVGLVDGRTAVFEIRYAEGRTERFPALTADLVRLGVDVLISTSTPGALAAKQATSTIPTVAIAVSDPVGSGIVANLGRPGGNITALSLLAPELSVKRLDLLRQALPQATRIAVLWNVANQGMALRFRETETAARTLGVTLDSVGVRTPDEFDAAFDQIAKRRPDALLVLADTVTVANRKRTVEFAEAYRLPAIYEMKEFVDAGGLMSYGIDFSEMYRRAALVVDKILKGAKPADIPVEQPRKFEFIVNQKAARAIGFAVRPSLLLRADQVIE